MNKAEQRALKALWVRIAYNVRPPYRRFRRRCHYSFINGCWMVPWEGMMVGIESDGHTHS